jgi:hypothetical protein
MWYWEEDTRWIHGLLLYMMLFCPPHITNEYTYLNLAILRNKQWTHKLLYIQFIPTNGYFQTLEGLSEFKVLLNSLGWKESWNKWLPKTTLLQSHVEPTSKRCTWYLGTRLGKRLVGAFHATNLDLNLFFRVFHFINLGRLKLWNVNKRFTFTFCEISCKCGYIDGCPYVEYRVGWRFLGLEVLFPILVFPLSSQLVLHVP